MAAYGVTPSLTLPLKGEGTRDMASARHVPSPACGGGLGRGRLQFVTEDRANV